MPARSRFLAFVALAFAASLVACSSTGAATAADAGEDAATCNPFGLSFSVTTDTDCVAIEPNPCCGDFIGFSCAQQGDAGGKSCSETDTCVRAARYDSTLCGGGTAYSCPTLNGSVSATLLSPPCTQMESIGPAGEGIRWCCGGNVTAPNLDAGAPPVSLDAAPPVTGDDASVKDAALD